VSGVGASDAPVELSITAAGEHKDVALDGCRVGHVVLGFLPAMHRLGRGLVAPDGDTFSCSTSFSNY
jgi:hypothetical protein